MGENNKTESIAIRDKIKGIISDRNIYSFRSYQIVYSWEDIISKTCSIPVISQSRSLWLLSRFFYKIKITRDLFFFCNKRSKPQAYYLYFSMVVVTKKLTVGLLKNTLPIIIDFWLEKDQLPLFYNYYSESKCLLITSKEVFSFLKENHCPIPIFHFPLSIPDKDVSEDYLIEEKAFDFIFPGRTDPFFWGYMKMYEETHPGIEYVYQKLEGKVPCYYSNKKGKLSGDFFSRGGYLSLLRKSRVAFYATPGMDESKNANGFNQLTPRFLELIASGCLVMGRYTINPDTSFYELEKYCPNIESYQDFVDTLNRFSNKEWERKYLSTYYSYLQKHITSARVPILNNIVSQL